jgi:hypothetical protein
MKSPLLLACIVVAILPSSAANAKEGAHTWISKPRGLVTITVGEDGGRIAGPGWEHKFATAARKLDFEIAPGRRFILRRSGESWGGEYFHPPIGSESHHDAAHKMTFACRTGICPNS